ncbi:MAG: MATE family efflux transporter [Lachnospiraceae bacterium]|nr:MATE family efflux transporter [Lachnospiraceae bacterium]
MRRIMERKGIYKRALMLAVPMMIQNGITNMVGLVDNVMVGTLGTESMTAVSIVGQLIFVFNLAVFGGLSGPGIYGAQYYGQGNEEGFRHTFRMKLWVSLVCIIVGTIIFLTAGENLIALYLHGESESVNPEMTMHYGKQYMAIMLFTLLPFSATQVYASSLRETGHSVKPMVAGIISVVVDIVFNYLLIFGKFGMPKMGVQGAAVATLLARMVECLIVVIWSHLTADKHTFLRGIYRTLCIPKDIAITMIRKGLPIFFNEFLWAGGMAALTQCYSTKGLELVAGMTISNAICNLLNVVFVALGSAVGILIGQTLGAGKYEKAKSDAFSLMWFTGGVCVILTVILVSISGVFPKAYDTTSQVRHYAQWFIIITALYFPVQGFLNALYFTLRSGGKTVVTFLFDSVFSWVVTIPAALLLCNLTTLPIFAIFAIVQSLDFIKVAVGYVLIKKGVWISKIVV